MASVTKTIAPASRQTAPRAFDIRNDLGEVADLVELCFADTLDRGGRDYLARLRAAANNGSLLRIAKSWSGAPMSGFVWEENDRIIGNVSLIPFYVRNRRYFLIANVAVHPSWRRRGIARKLTAAAVNFSRQRHAPAVWLHVRVENQAALDLYSSLHFAKKAVRTTWYADPGPASGDDPPGLRFMVPGRSQWEVIKAWLRQFYPPEYTWHMPYHLHNLQPGLIGFLFRLVFNTYVRKWGVVHEGRMQAFAAWQTADAQTNFLWLAAPPESDPYMVQSLLEYALQHTPTRRGVSLEFPAYQYDQAIREAGFREQQTLVWMELPLL